MKPTWLDVINSSQQFIELKTEYWLNEVLFSFSWWVIFITTIGIFIVWIIIVDKKRIIEIITYGFFVGTVAIFADVLGISLGLWSYPNTLIPVPLNLEIHRMQMPVIYMILYQYFKTWKAFFIAAAINALVFSFVLEQLLVWLEIYEPYHWKHIYSVIPYFVIAIGFKWLIIKLKQLDKNYL